MLANNRDQFFRRNSLDDKIKRCARAEKIQRVDFINKIQVEKSIGQHLLAEFSLSESFNITPETLGEVIFKAAEKSKATILHKHFFKTATGGISGVVVISESHFIVHYFPADKYLALDIYTCGDKIKINSALKHIRKSLKLTPYDTMIFKRGVLAKNLSDPSTLKPRKPTLKPGIATENDSTLRFFKENRGLEVQGDRSSIATHWVGELYCSDTRITNDAKRILNAFETEFPIVPGKYSYQHNFEPWGATVVVIGDGFHVTTHPWPELYYTPVDLFIHSQSNVNPEEIMKHLVNSFKSEKYTMHRFPRGAHNKENELLPIFKELLPNVESPSMSLRR